MSIYFVWIILPTWLLSETKETTPSLHRVHKYKAHLHRIVILKAANRDQQNETHSTWIENVRIPESFVSCWILSLTLEDVFTAVKWTWKNNKVKRHWLTMPFGMSGGERERKRKRYGDTFKKLRQFSITRKTLKIDYIISCLSNYWNAFVYGYLFV